jgi:hypothetical protein
MFGLRVDFAFNALTLLILPLWILMIFFPKWDVSVRILRSPWPIAPIALAYVAVIASQIATLLPLLLAPEPAAQMAYLGTPAGFLAIWAHVLTLDLFAGRWVYLDGYTAGRSPWVMSPVLFCVMILAPLGLLLHLGIRARTARSLERRAPRKSDPYPR